MYSETILEHFRRPRRFGELAPADRSGEAHNPLCGDRVRITLRLDGEIIADARFRAEACAICMAAASLLTDSVAGMRVRDAAAVTEAELIARLRSELREERRRCATLPMEALHSALGPEAIVTHSRNEEAQMSDPKARGRFVWYDLMTTDPEGAIAFYTAVVGWGTQQWNGGGAPYTMWMTGNAPIGGVARADGGGAPPHWLVSIATPDVDATVQRAQELGGRVISPPQDIPDVGRWAVLTDPQGAVFGVFAAQGHTPGHEGPPKLGEFSWHELITTDYEAALRFYSELFGWEKDQAMDMGPAGIYQLFKRNGRQIGGMYNLTPDNPSPPNWLCYAKVDDVKTRVDTIRRLGGQILVDPMEVPGGDWIIVGLDPQGAAFALHSSANA